MPVMDYAPIAYFAFNRPVHAKRSLAALAACHGAQATDIHIFVDGTRTPEDEPQVARVIDIVNNVAGFANVDIRVAASNLGLYRSITEGVTSVVSRAGRVIVVEDDLLVSAHFLSYMNDALNTYQNNPEVGCIHAYVPEIDGLPEYFFLRGADCWGWATWRDRWELFDADAKRLLRTLVESGQLGEFCLSHGSDALLHLVRRKHGRNASWGALWHASLFLAERLTLHPCRSFAQNIGNDGSGTHTGCSAAGSPPREKYDGLPALDLRQERQAALRMGYVADGKHPSLRRAYAKMLATTSDRFF